MIVSAIAHAVICLLPILAGQGIDDAVQRFPPPDFESGYELPVTTTPAPRAQLLSFLDMAVLLACVSLASFFALKKRSRKAIFGLALFSLAYFGFYREGCVCPIGAVQNVTLALFDSGYAIPVSVLFFFIIPLLFTLFFGRVFCAAVCPLGAFQDLALVRPVAVPPALQHALGLLAYLYLGAAVLFAATGSAFIICEYDPFVAIFRLSGSANMVVLGFSFLLISIFVGRPYCRFFCPYGVLLRWLSRVSKWRVTITPSECIRCRLCEESCPFGAIDPATPEEAARPGGRDKRRLVLLLSLIPVLVLAGMWLGSIFGKPCARMHATVRLAERIQQEEAGLEQGTVDASEAFRNTGETISSLYEEARLLREEFVFGGSILGAFLGLAVAFKLISLSLFRSRAEYEADRAGCYACARCFSYCPVELDRLKQQKGRGAEPEERKRSVKRSASLGVAVVAGAFSLVVIVLMASSFVSQKASLSGKEPLHFQRLAELKNSLVENPGDGALVQEFREMDLEEREEYFLEREFIRRGAYLLLAGLAVFVMALKRVHVIGQEPPMPQPAGEEPDLHAKALGRARRAVTVSALLIAGSFLALASIGEVDLVLPSTESSSGESETGLPAEHAPPTPEEIRKNWPRFRGPGGLGISSFDNAPEKWDAASGKGILWKTEVVRPGYGSPVVWGDRVFLSGADEQGKEVFCFDADTGELLWQRMVERVPGNTGIEVEVYEDTGYAASTMAVDGERAYALFVDGDAACFDFDGNLLWARNMGLPDNLYGYATSPTFHENSLLIQYDQGQADDRQSVLFALEGSTGRTKWQQFRPVAGSWTSPILIDTGAEQQLITCSDPLVIAYDPVSGKLLWQADLMGTDVAPSPVYANELVFVIQPYSALHALRTDGRGDVTETHLAWTVDCAAPDICSPVSNGELIFLLSTMGGISCYETGSGELVWEHEIDAMFQASPSLVGEWILLLSEDGDMYRVKASREFEQAESVSGLGETVKASPAFVNGRIYIRGDVHLFCIGEE